MVKTTFYYDNTEIIFEGLFESDHIYKQLSIKNNFYELKLLNKIKSLNLTGTYVDVGANIGNHTVFFSKFCPSDKVISIELSQNIFEVLNRNVNENNNLSNVELINVGVGEKYKTVTISDMDVTNVGMTKITSDGGDVIVDTLDNILQNETNISVIKIDVEGYEKNVLIGAKEIIKKHSPIIIAELKDDKEFNEFKEIADEIGYVTDKVNYASTPTYIWVKKKKIINSFI
jgi:FkbM family methyltransferase